jgi:hypothetical protein
MPGPSGISNAAFCETGAAQAPVFLYPKKENGVVSRCAIAWMGMACVEVRRIEKVIRRASTKVMTAKILHQIDAGPFSFLGLSHEPGNGLGIVKGLGPSRLILPSEGAWQA